MMCYSDKDDELWNEDPYEYIRMKFGQYTCVKYMCVHMDIACSAHPIINPRRACAARVTVLGRVCVSVCLCVC